MSAAALLDQWYKIAGIVIAVPVAWVVARNISGFFRYIRVVHEAIAGRPKTPIDPGQPSMIERFEAHDLRFDKQDEELSKIKAELSYNGGGSTKDQVRKLVAGQAAAAQTAATVKKDLG